jgi:hypothetical protein
MKNAIEKRGKRRGGGESETPYKIKPKTKEI